jgi:hypothetical protein
MNDTAGEPMTPDRWLERIEELLTLQQQQLDVIAKAMNNLSLINGGIQNSLYAIKEFAPCQEEEVTIAAKVGENGQLVTTQ